MPTYEYRCHGCEVSFEARQTVARRSSAACPSCGGEAEVVFSLPHPSGIVTPLRLQTSWSDIAPPGENGQPMSQHEAFHAGFAPYDPNHEEWVEKAIEQRLEDKKAVEKREAPRRAWERLQDPQRSIAKRKAEAIRIS